jgi:hypothetical protein
MATTKKRAAKKGAAPATKKRAGRKPLHPEGGTFVNIMLDKQMLSDIDDFRYANRIPTRTEAMRWLMGFALQQDPQYSGE